eukprot:3194039-Rhodomonas_salina.2
MGGRCDPSPFIQLRTKYTCSTLKPVGLILVPTSARVRGGPSLVAHSSAAFVSTGHLVASV